MCRPLREGDGTSTHRSEEHTSELQSPCNFVCRLLLEKKKCHRRRRSPSALPVRRCWSACSATTPSAPRRSLTTSAPGRGAEGSAPRDPRVGGIVGQDGSLDEAVRAVGRVVHLPVVLQPERGEIDEEGVLVGQGQPYFADRGLRRDDPFPDGVQGLLE